MSQDNIIPKKPKKKGLYISVISLSRMEKRLLNVMSKDIVHLMKSVANGGLNKVESEACRAYLKLVKDLRARQDEEAKEYADEELDKLAQD